MCRFGAVKADPIAGLRSSAGSLISLYAGRPSPGGFGALLSDLVKPLRQKSESLDRAVQKSVRSDGDRIQALAPQLEEEFAPAYAIFASSLDDVFVLEPLTHPTANVSVLGPRPYLRPLRAAPRSLRSGVLVADRALARTFVGFSGLVDEIGPPLTADIGKANFGGFSGYREHTVRARAEEESTRMWREAGARLLRAHQEGQFDYLALGAHEETHDEIARTLHPYLARLPRSVFVANPQEASESSLRDSINSMDIEVRRKRQAALAGRVCDTAWSSGNAVVGLTATLEASNTGAIDTLVVAGRFSRPGVICGNCSHLGRDGTTCPVCGHNMFEADDIVASVMEATVSNGGTVHQIEVASALDPRGIGAMTRFTVVN